MDTKDVARWVTEAAKQTGDESMCYVVDDYVRRFDMDPAHAFAMAFAALVRAAALEEALKACEGEDPEDPPKYPEDRAYSHAVRDCAAAIRALATPS